MTLHSLRMHVTEQPVGECMDCGFIDGAHMNGCTTPLLAQKMVQVAAALVDLDQPAKGFITIDTLAQNLGLSAMDMRSLVSNLLGFVPQSARVALTEQQAVTICTHVAVA